MGLVSVRPVVLCGGSGARLWPLSTPEKPKPFLALTGERTLFQETLLRVSDPVRYAPPLVIAAHGNRFLAGAQMEAAGVAGRLVLEPLARGTAVAVAVASLIAAQEDPGALLLILPADHHIPDAAAFAAAIGAGATAAADHAVVLFGVPPTGPATGFGYICPAPCAAPGAQRIRAFVEKPEAAHAPELVAGGALWNAGIFLARADVLITEFEAHAPAVLEAARGGLAGACFDADFLRLAEAPMSGLPELSFDRAVVEKTVRGAVVEAGFAWSDIGAWSSLHALAPTDAAGNTARGPVRLIDAERVYARSDGRPLAVVGLSDIIVVATADGILVTRPGADQAVRFAATGPAHE